MITAKTLKQLDVSKLKMLNGKTVKQDFMSEVNRLKDLIQANVDKYVNSYTPVQYQRTGQLQRSIRVGDITVKGNRLSARIYFDDGAVMRKSGYGMDWEGTGETVNILLLMDRGYHVTKPVFFKDIEHFGFRNAALFIENAIIDFNRTSPYYATFDYEY